MISVFQLAFAFVVIHTFAAAAGENSDGSSEYYIEGESDRELDIACGWPTPPAECLKSLNQIELRPGAAVAIDNFLNGEEYKFLRGAVEEGIVKADSRYGKKEEDTLNSSFSSLVRMPNQEKEQFILALMKRIHGNAMRTIRSLSAFEEGPWAYKGAYFPDYWTIRRYHSKNGTAADRLRVHSDTGMYARCLSAVMFFGEEVTGGTFRTHRCKSSNCTVYGWQYDQRFPSIDQSLLVDSNLETLAEVPYKAGRLVFFLAETLHDVSETTDGNRDVFFMWFGCSPVLGAGVGQNGHAALVEFLVSQNADINKPVSTKTGQRPLHASAINGYVDVVKFLVTHDPNSVHIRQGVRGRTGVVNGSVVPEFALHGAAAMGHTDVVKILIKGRADVLAKDSQGKTAEDYAWRFAPRGRDAVVVDLLKRKDEL